MRINPIGLGYGNLKPNKVEKNNSKVMSNPIKDSRSLAKLSLEQLQGMNNISFRGNGYNPDEIIELLTIFSQDRKTEKIQNFLNQAKVILNSPLLNRNKKGQTFFHKATGEDLEVEKEEITPQLLKFALTIKDNKGNTCFHYAKDPKFATIVAEILGDEAPITFAKTCAIKNDCYENVIDKMIKYNRQNELESLFKALGNKTADFVRNYADDYDTTIFHHSLQPKVAQTIVDNMDSEEAQQVLSEMLPMQNYWENTFLHNDQYPETLEIYAKALGNKAPEIFAKACLARNLRFIHPIDELISYYNGVQERLDESKVVFKTLGNKTAEVVRNYRDKTSRTVFHYLLKPELAQIIIDNIGNEAPEILSKMLPMQDDWGRTCLHYMQYPETIEIYAKALGNKAPEVFRKSFYYWK